MCLVVSLLPHSLSAQLSYQASRPLKFESPATRAKAKTELPAISHRPRFRGWKHTANARQNFAGCGAACFPAMPAVPESAARPSAYPFAQTPMPSSFSSFALRPTLPAGAIPTAVAMGDFNGDGHLDWAVSNGGDSSIWIYLGKGDGTSNLPTIISLTGLAPLWLTAVELRGNGMLDLVVAEADSGTVGVLLGNGDGTFQTEVEYSVPAPPLFVLAGDFNGDGKLDIAVGMAGSTTTGPVAVLPGDGLGHLGAALYAAAQVPSIAAWLATADLNGDGKLDLVVVDSEDTSPPHGGAQVYLNNGNGTFTAGQLFFENAVVPGVPPVQALSAALADLNGDGCTDAVVTDGYGLAWIYTGNCKGTFSNPAFSQVALGDIGGAIQLVDMNNDGKLDIVTSGVVLNGAGGSFLGDIAGNLVSVLFGDGTGHFSSGRVYRGEPSMYGLAVGDVNGDGFPDVVTANQDSNSASVFLNDGQGGFGDPQGEPIGYNSGTTNSPVSPFLFADVDGNGTQDIVVLEVPPLYPGSMQITTMLNNGAGIFSPPIQSAAWPENQFPPWDFVLADFRNTGRPDLLVDGVGPSPTLFFAPNVGGGKFGASSLTTPAGAFGLLAVGDFNGDGNLDFVTLSGNDINGSMSQQLNVFLGNGDGTFRSGQSISFGDANSRASAVVVYVGDFNRDGKLDILALTDGLYEFLGNGDGTFQPARALFSTFGAFALADVNRDGWPDIVAMTDQFGNATLVPTISVFLGQADGSFQYLQTYTPYLDALRPPPLLGVQIPGNPFEALLGDFNGDGNPDLAILEIPYQGQVQSFVQILFGNGDGTFTPDYVAFLLNEAYAPQFAVDVNGDGLADLIELDSYTSSFNVVESVLGGPSLQLEVLTNPVTGNTGYGRVILSVPSTTSTSVSLTASDPNIVVPAVVVPAGSVSQDFQFSIGSGFNLHNVFTIQAQMGSSTATAYTYVSSVPVPVVDLEPAALLFGYVNVASTSNPQSVTLKNLGSAPLTPAISASTWFSETNDCGSSVVPGGTCTVQVTVTAPSLGLVSGALYVSDNTYGVSAGVGLEGFGLGLQLVPCCLSFVTNVGTTSPSQKITMTNQETSALQITTQLYPPDEGFAEVNDCGSTLAAGASCQFTVTFSPLQSGTATDMIQITDNSPIDYSYGVTLFGAASDFALNTTGGSVTVTAGQTATFPFSVASLSGFVGTVSLSCAGAPQAATCTVSPSSVNVASDQSSSFTVTLTTTAQTTSSLAPGRMKPLRLAKVSFGLAGAMLGVFVVWIPQRRKQITTVVALFLASLMCSCGGGGSGGGGGGAGGGTGGNGGGGGGSSGTPSGSYSLTIKGTAGALSHSIGVTLTVN
jgi:hypothetical protein